MLLFMSINEYNVLEFGINVWDTWEIGIDVWEIVSEIIEKSWEEDVEPVQCPVCKWWHEPWKSCACW